VRRSILESVSSLLELTDDVDTQDSLWAAEDIDAIFDQDPQRVANRPIKETLGGIEDYIVKTLLEKCYDNDESRVPYIDYIGSVPATINSTLASSYGINDTSDKISTTYKFGSSLPPVEE
jgi:fatty acid synthase subunit alpha